jgi:hypothetical protein
MKKFIKEVIGYTTAILLTCGIILVSAMAAPDGDTSLAIDENSAIPLAPEWYDYDHENGTFLEPGALIQIPDGCYAYMIWYVCEDRYEYIISDVDLFAEYDYFMDRQFTNAFTPTYGEITLEKTRDDILILQPVGLDGFFEVWQKNSGGKSIVVETRTGGSMENITKLGGQLLKLPETLDIRNIYDDDKLEAIPVKKWKYGIIGTNDTIGDAGYTFEYLLKNSWANIDGEIIKNSAHIVSILPVF